MEWATGENSKLSFEGAGRGVPKRNTLLLSGCLDSGHRSCWLRRRTRAAEVLTYADVWATMETAGRAAGTGTGSKRNLAFSGQGTEDSRTAGTVGEQDGRGLAAGAGQTLPVPLTKDTC